jgi:hypothetical protein
MYEGHSLFYSDAQVILQWRLDARTSCQRRLLSHLCLGIVSFVGTSSESVASSRGQSGGDRSSIWPSWTRARTHMYEGHSLFYSDAQVILQKRFDA